MGLAGQVRADSVSASKASQGSDISPKKPGLRVIYRGYGAMQYVRQVTLNAIDASLPWPPLAVTMNPLHGSTGGRPVWKRPWESARTVFRRDPAASRTCSFGLKPDPATRRGITLLIARVAGLADPFGAAEPADATLETSKSAMTAKSRIGGTRV